MNKTIITPSFYSDFRCLAGVCPDTCCKGWDIVVDDETKEFYDSLPDDGVKKNITVDEDGDTVLRFIEGVCPFLTGAGLCEIQSRYGAERICQTCREFPRITQDYTEFEERLLTLACPEAARLMIIKRGDFSFVTDSRVLREDNGYDRELMNFLLHARFLTAEIFRGEGAFSEKLSRCFSLTLAVQDMLDREDFSSEPQPRGNVSLPDIGEIFDLHKGMDVMDEGWLDEVGRARDFPRDSRLDGELSSLALYYIAHYYLNAVSSYDVVTNIFRMYCACEVCAALIGMEGAFDDDEKRTLIYQKYSKEIEHSDENYEIFEERF